MNAPQQKTCVFYSKGPHFLRALQTMRKTYPNARLEAWVPQGFPVPEQTTEFADAIVETKRAAYGLRDLSALRELVGALREARFACVGLMFPSVKLKILASLSGAKGAWCTPDGRFVPLSNSIAGAVAGELFYGAVGRMTYWSIWLVVVTIPVLPRKGRFSPSRTR